MAPPVLQALLGLFLVELSTSVGAAACGPAYYNASGSVNVPFPQPPKLSPSDPSGNYTLSTQLSFPAGPLGLRQLFRAVNASGNATEQEPLNYEGCLIVFSDSFWPSTKGHINEPDQTSCQSAFSSDCISETMSDASGIANGFSQQNRLLSDVGCGQFTPPNCVKAGIYASGIFTSEADQQSLDFVGNSSSNSSATCRNGELFSLSGFEAGGKLSTYLKRIDSVTPVMVVAWNNASSNPGGKAWSDVRFFCMSTDNITPGSKSGAPWMGSASFGWYLSWVSSISCLLLFIM